MEATRPLTADAIAPLLRTRELGRVLQCLPETTSTSEVALRLGFEGAPHGTVVIAESQTAGRGRRGRSWTSPPGLNLYLSLLLRPAFSPSHAPELTLVTAVAACETLRAAGCAARIKWPNDLEIEGRKVAGILAEMHAVPDRVEFVIVGIGVDLNMRAEDLPPDLREIATSVRMARGEPIDRAVFCADLLLGLERWFERHAAEGFAPVKHRWTELSSTVGLRVRAVLVDGELEGEALGIDDDGALRIRTDAGGVERLVAGDVQNLRPR